MRVVGISLMVVRLPLVHGFETSSHRKRYLDHILVKMTESGGRVGWGEIASPSDPWFCSETVDTAMLISEKYLVPTVLAAEWDRPDQLAQEWRRVRGHEFAKAGFDIAAWDLFAAAQGQSLAAAMGGSRATVQAGVSMGIEPSVDKLVAEAAKHVAAGYGRIKLKIKPGWDVTPVRAVRAAFPSVLVHVDANGVYDSDPDTMATMRELDRLGVALVEQPFGPRNFVAHAELQRQLEIPVCLDESIVEVTDIDTAASLGACGSVNIKVSRMGGLTNSIAAHEAATRAGMLVWCGGMHEFGIGRAANLALSALSGFTYPSDVSGSDKYYVADIVDPPIVANDGEVAVPTGPGLGHRVLEDRVTAASISQTHFGKHLEMA